MKQPLLIHEVAPKIQSGELTPVQLLDRCLEQIDRYESQVKAWVFVAREEAREQAEELTRELQRGLYRGPLHGIPVGVKDIIDVREWPTAAGSKRWQNAIAREDAHVVRQLRDAGCVFLGKTVTTAFASFDPPVTRNPWNLSKTPGGSSSGSAAAVACGMCLAALATQTGGSITRPAAYCGVASLKPRLGDVSTWGVVPLAQSMDHVGVMANSVADLKLIYERISLGKVSFPKAISHRERALAILDGLFEQAMGTEMKTRFARLLEELQKANWSIERRPLPEGFATISEDHLCVMAVEAAQWHADRFRRYPDDYPPKVRALIESGFKTPAPRYADAKAKQVRMRNWIDFETHDLPIRLTPATDGEAVDATTTGNPVMNSPWSFIGYPTISIPFGWSENGLPLSIQLIQFENDTLGLFEPAIQLEQLLAFPRRDLPL